jgi:hypothetical protein
MVNSAVCILLPILICILILPMFQSWSVSCSYTLLGLVVILELERDG